MNLLHKIRSLATAGAVALSPFLAHAAAFQLPTLSQEDFDKLEREMSAVTTLHSVTPPSALGSIWGFELGVVAGATRTPEIDAQVKRASPTTSVSMLPHAGLLGAVTVPFGVTAEATYLPQISTNEASYQQYAVAVKWTVTDNLLSILPLNLAVRGFYAKSDFSFKQAITESGVSYDSTVKNENRVTGFQLLASPKLIPVLEPYVGVGFLSANGKLNISGPPSATLLGFTPNQSADVSTTSTQFLLGLDVRLLVLGIGAEYQRAFGTDSYTAKLSLKF